MKKAVNADHTIQMIQKDEGHSFIVFQSSHDISVNYIAGVETFEILIDEKIKTYSDLQLYVYELDMKNGPEKIVLYINGVEAAFDNITII